ncbi:uncharacterized mitochondrial protein AtMg00810-like [Vicia villosa]|uniref:uncharacterized mitochondrial protein AtMg00810-like n=1 Tax=Vicia villosa TaxID=3911 RepID=UPI00273CD154|nr:uncharacterized mitochondrial protein AtMg00810-like [Vicia villosa]
MEVACTKDGIYMSQRKYTLVLLQETRMLGCKAANTPMESISRCCSELNPQANKERYQSLVGKLIYLTHIRLDIGFIVSMTSRYMSSPTEAHMKVVNKTLQYLKGTPGRGHFKKNSNRDIEVYTDSDWASCISDENSTTVYCSFVGGNMVSWRSSAEAGFGVMTQLKKILDEIRIQTNYIISLCCNNKAGIDIAKNLVHHDRTKHVEID